VEQSAHLATHARASHTQNRAGGDAGAEYGEAQLARLGDAVIPVMDRTDPRARRAIHAGGLGWNVRHPPTHGEDPAAHAAPGGALTQALNDPRGLRQSSST